MKVAITEIQRLRLIERLDDVQGSPLYHHTSEERAVTIMDQNKLRGSVPDEDYLEMDPRLKGTKNQSAISLTRDKNFEPGSTIGASWDLPSDLNVIFVLDSNKLKTKYKVEPFNYSSIDPRIFQDMGYEKNPELEERVLTKYIYPLDRYVTDIIYKGNNPEVKQKIESFLSNQVNESEELKELAPTSAGVEEFVDEVKELSGSLKHLGFKSMKALQKFIEEAGYDDFQELKDDLEKFKEEKKSIKEQSQDNPLPKVAIKLFKFLNGERKKYKKKKDLEDYIQNALKYIGLDQSLSRYYTELYLMNYRADGKYEDITPSTFVDPRMQKGKTITNTQSYKYTKAMMPFKGSNLRGEWWEDRFGVPLYVVTSYNWYPIFINKKGRWYEVTGRYSSSTGRQMGNADPAHGETRWDRNLDAEVFLMSPEEMKKLKYDGEHEQMMRDKKERLLKNKEELQKRRLKSLSDWADTPTKIKFKIKDVQQDGDKVNIVVDVIDVLRRTGNVAIATPENYTKGELRGVTKDHVEKRIIANVVQDLKEYIGKRLNNYYNIDLSKNDIDFKFNHLRENN